MNKINQYVRNSCNMKSEKNNFNNNKKQVREPSYFEGLTNPNLSHLAFYTAIKNNSINISNVNPVSKLINNRKNKINKNLKEYSSPTSTKIYIKKIITSVRKTKNYKIIKDNLIKDIVKDVMNINEDNKKNMFKTDIEINKISNDTQNQINEIQNGDNNQYMGQIHEEYGYNINENQQGQEEGNNEQYENEYNNEEQQNENEQYEEEQGEEYIEQQGEEYEEMQGEEEQYNYEEQNEEGNYGEEEQMEEYDEEQDNGEEQVEFENNNEQINEENNNNNEQETPK